MEQIHQSISTMIAISLRENSPSKYEDVSPLVFRKCMAAQFAIRSTINSSLKNLILNINQFKNKLERTVLNEGPWAIKEVHPNGTVAILRNE